MRKYNAETVIHPEGFTIWAPNGFTVTRNIPARDPWIGNKWVLTGFPVCTYPVIITMFTTPKPVDIKTAINARAARLWVEDIAYAERRYQLRAHSPVRLRTIQGGAE